jgi:hypothetical protein
MGWCIVSFFLNMGLLGGTARGSHVLLAAPVQSGSVLDWIAKRDWIVGLMTAAVFFGCLLYGFKAD